MTPRTTKATAPEERARLREDAEVEAHYQIVYGEQMLRLLDDIDERDAQILELRKHLQILRLSLDQLLKPDPVEKDPS